MGLDQKFLEHIVKAPSQYDDMCRELAAEILTLRKSRCDLLMVLKNIVDDLEARWDMRDAGTNPGIRHNVEQAKVAIATAELS